MSKGMEALRVVEQELDFPFLKDGWELVEGETLKQPGQPQSVWEATTEGRTAAMWRPQHRVGV